ncbi:MAG TPA: DUF4240 domain-containing protein [Phaeodactylibacter sp.]|nr:DUF4240 domain-containing protein [Phaeodactylibacter sp.]
MLTKLHIGVEELSPEWIKQLQERYDNAQLEIIVHEPEEVKAMSEAAFWAIIEKLDWSKGEDDDAILAPAVQVLSAYTVRDIERFQDILAEKLFQLDKQAYAEQIGTYAYGGDRNFSVDIFLYARACVIANGKDFYYNVLSNPSKMPKEFTFEPLLYLAGLAYQKKTGTEWKYLPEVSYETYSNREGWGGKSWLDNL